MSGLVSTLEGNLSKWQEEIHGALRIVVAFMFIQHGTQKLFGFPVPMNGEFDLMTLSPGVSGVLEVFVAPFVLVGLFTRPISFLLSGFMAAAYFMRHADPLIWTRANGGEAAAFYCFVFLFLAAAGGGAWSLDNALRKG